MKGRVWVKFLDGMDGIISSKEIETCQSTGHVIAHGVIICAFVGFTDSGIMKLAELELQDD